jgi:MFS family permease
LLGGVILLASSAGTGGTRSAVTIVAASVAGGCLVLLLVVKAVTRVRIAPHGLFRRRGAIGFVIAAVLNGSTLVVYYFSSIYLQEVQGFSGSKTGLAFGLWALTIVAAAKMAPAIVLRFGIKVTLTVSMVLAIAGTVVFAVAIGPDTPFLPWVALSFALLGFGLGAAGVPATLAALESSVESDRGASAGILNACQSGGGVVLLAAATAAASAHEAFSIANGSAGGQGAALGGITFSIFAVAALLAVIAFAALIVLPNGPSLRRRKAERVEATAVEATHA